MQSTLQFTKSFLVCELVRSSLRPVPVPESLVFLEAHLTDKETNAQGSDWPESHSRDSAPSLPVSELPCLLESVARAPAQSSPCTCIQGAHSAFVTWPESWALAGLGAPMGSLEVGLVVPQGSQSCGTSFWQESRVGAALARTWWSQGTGETVCQSSSTPHASK